jgi:hypothetical protein
MSAEREQSFAPGLAFVPRLMSCFSELSQSTTDAKVEDFWLQQGTLTHRLMNHA